jgi:SAM-dependent methyltransferase
VGVDLAEDYIAYARAHAPDERLTFRIGDVQALDLDAATFDVAVSGLVLNFVPHPERMVAEMARVVRPGGVVALYVWDYAGEMQLMRRFWDAAVALDPVATERDEGRRVPPLCQPEPLARYFRDAGLHAVTTHALDVPTVFRDFDDYWTPFLGGQGSAPGYARSLTEKRRAALRERIRATLPVAADGSIPLMARAWAVRGMSAS